MIDRWRVDPRQARVEGHGHLRRRPDEVGVAGDHVKFAVGAATVTYWVVHAVCPLLSVIVSRTA